MNVFDGVPIPMMKLPPWFHSQSGVPGSDTPEGLRTGTRSLVYYVDRTHTEASDNNDGTDPRAPKLTIASAITASNATIDWADDFGGTKPYNWIYIGPGVYQEALTSLPHYCHVVGTGVLGTDGATEIHPAAGSAIAGTQINGRWCNIWFETETAVPIIDFNICNNVLVEHCCIVRGIAGLATIGIDFSNASHAQICNNVFASGVAAIPTGINFAGGGDIFAHFVRIVGNYINCGTTGINIPNTCTASGAWIHQNVIARPVTGIQDLNGGSFCTDNWITASTDAINHANLATNCIANHVIDAAVGGVEAANTD
jgi:hypothetical protein